MYYNKMNYTTNRQNFTVTQRVLILNYDYTLTDTLKMAVGSQTVLRKGKPERKCAVLQRFFNPMLIFSLLISVYVLIAYINGDAPLTPKAPMFLGEPAEILPVYLFEYTADNFVCNRFCLFREAV